MAAQFPMSNVPSDPYQWRESVLSTRSLSYVSNADMAGTGTDSPRGSISRNTSHFFTSAAHTRKNTLSSIPDPTDAEVLSMHNRARQESIDTATLTSPTHHLSPSVAACPLFQLPREIRELIYSHALSSSYGFNFPADTLIRSCSPQLLGTCKAIYEETAPLLYTSNKLIFSHPSDANIFRHAIASSYSANLSTIILRVKNVDTRLWTAYFNSTNQERSLVKDYPNLKHLYLRFRGPRFQQFFSHEQNALHWIRDTKLQEAIVSVRKCVVGNVTIELCVKVPEDWQQSVWEAAIVRAAAEQDTMPGPILRRGECVGMYGVWLKLVTDGT